MKNFLKLAAVAAISMACTQGLHSHLLIEAGKQFVLGGGQPGAFTVSGKNVGPVPVKVQERHADGSITERGTLEPRQKARLDFAKGSAALLLNSSTQKAELDLDVSGRTSGLGMTYEGLKP